MAAALVWYTIIQNLDRGQGAVAGLRQEAAAELDWCKRALPRHQLLRAIMLGFIIQRVLLAIPTVFAVTALLFFSITTLLGSPATMMLGENATPEAIADLNARHGFDRPAYVQYIDWVWHALKGDFGRSFTTQQPVASALLPAIPVTLELAFWSILIAGALAVALNSIPRWRPAMEPAIISLNILGVTVPNFMLAITLVFVFAVTLGWLPSTGWVPWSDGIVAHVKHLILPVATLSAYYFGAFSMVFRAEQRDVYRKLYIQVARSKGLSEWKVAFKHAMPNAVLPVVTFMGLAMGQLTGGAVVTETVFSMPGVGRLFVASIAAHDFPVMLAIAMMVVVAVVAMNILVDFIYTLLNPQIRLE
jgi:peptide/nickel transport system permease protein